MCDLVPWVTKLYLFTNLWEYIKGYTEKTAKWRVEGVFAFSGFVFHQLIDFDQLSNYFLKLHVEFEEGK